MNVQQAVGKNARTIAVKRQAESDDKTIHDKQRHANGDPVPKKRAAIIPRNSSVSSSLIPVSLYHNSESSQYTVINLRHSQMYSSIRRREP